MVGLRQLNRFRSIVADRGFMTGESKGARQRGQSVGFVIHDQQAGLHGFSLTSDTQTRMFVTADNLSRFAGNSMINVVPRPSSPLTLILPPWSLTMDWTLARRRPVP